MVDSTITKSIFDLLILESACMTCRWFLHCHWSSVAVIVILYVQNVAMCFIGTHGNIRKLAAKVSLRLSMLCSHHVVSFLLQLEIMTNVAGETSIGTILREFQVSF